MLKSISKNQLLPIEGYILPSGSSPIHPYYLPSSCNPLQQQQQLGVFHGIRIVNTAAEFWSKILLRAGANLQSMDKSTLLSTITTSRSSSGRVSILPDYVVIDPLSYVDGIQEPLEHKLISHCIRFNSPQLVTTDWIVYCLQVGEIVNPKLSTVFEFHNDVQKPLVFKGIKERFEIHDIVYFKTAANDRAVGRVLEFTRRSIESPLMVRILPFKVEEIGKRRTLKYSDQNEMLVAATSLDGRPVVLSHSAYSSAEYASGDVTVLSADEEWARQEQVRVAGGGLDEPERSIFFSQDY